MLYEHMFLFQFQFGTIEKMSLLLQKYKEILKNVFYFFYEHIFLGEYLYFCKKFKMEIEIFSDDGSPLEYEDVVAYVIWKIPYLKEEGYTEQEIVQYDDNEQWRKSAQVILKLKY